MSGVLLWVVSPKENASLFSSSPFSFIPRNGIQKRLQISSRLKFPTGFSAAANAVANPSRSSEERVYEVVLKQAALVREQKRDDRALDFKKNVDRDGMMNWDLLNVAYDRCGEVCAEYAKTFYLGTFPHFCLCSPPYLRICNFWLIFFVFRSAFKYLSDFSTGFLSFQTFSRLEDLSQRFCFLVFIFIKGYTFFNIEY